MAETRLHPDWATEPHIRDGFKPLPRRQRAVAYIVGTGKDGLNYCRVVGTNHVNSEAESLLQETLLLVKKLGPTVCRVYSEGGVLPGEDGQPELIV
jgi:hypothetical protein